MCACVCSIYFIELASSVVLDGNPSCFVMFVEMVLLNITFILFLKYFVAFSECLENCGCVCTSRYLISTV